MIRKESTGSPRTRNAMVIHRKGTMRKEDTMTMNEDSMSRIARETLTKR